jgi:hypothetical protein
VNSFEFIIDPSKVSLQITGGCLDKVSVLVKDFGRDMGFATDQDKKWLALL